MRDRTDGQLNPGAIVFGVARNQITMHGTITQPTASPDAGQAGIACSLLIGHNLWTVSDGGLMVNDQATLSRQVWIQSIGRRSVRNFSGGSDSGDRVGGHAAEPGARPAAQTH